MHWSTEAYLHQPRFPAINAVVSSFAWTCLDIVYFFCIYPAFSSPTLYLNSVTGVHWSLGSLPNSTKAGDAHQSTHFSTSTRPSHVNPQVCGSDSAASFQFLSLSLSSLPTLTVSSPRGQSSALVLIPTTQSLEQSTIKQERRGRRKRERERGRETKGGNNSPHCVCRHMVRPVWAGSPEKWRLKRGWRRGGGRLLSWPETLKDQVSHPPLSHPHSIHKALNKTQCWRRKKRGKPVSPVWRR